MVTNLYECIAHALHLKEAFFIGAYQNDSNRLFFRGSIVRSTASVLSKIEEADIHVEVPTAVEAWEAHWNPALATASFNSFSFKDHVKKELQIAGVQRMLLGPDNTNKPTACHDQAIEKAADLSLQESVVDRLSMRFANLEAFQCGK